ncbi:MAG: DUF4175 family protein [Cyclobacteriaceae bacterium]
MAAGTPYKQLIERLRSFKKKYYANLLIKGAILSGAIIASAYLLINSLEYTLHFGSVIRAVLLFSFIILGGWVLFHWVMDPVFRLFTLNRQISNESAARQIGKFFPEVKDKLLNTLQLHELSHQENSLIQASIEQRTHELNVIPFRDAINLKENRKYLKYIIPPLALLIMLLLLIPQFFTESTARILQFNKEFNQAPFSFQLQNNSLTAFKNEDFVLELKLDGAAIPESVYLNHKDRLMKMSKNAEGNFEYTFRKLQFNADFSFEAAGFSSSDYQIEVVNRPNLKSFDIGLDYPSYLNRKDESLKNTGNIQVPEGTLVQWRFNSLHTESLKLFFLAKQETFDLEMSDNEQFTFNKKVTASDSYKLELSNGYSKNKDAIEYSIDVIKDQYPEISLDQYRDTTLFSFVIFGGNISDDHGISRLSLFYRVKDNGQRSGGRFNTLPIPIKSQQLSQNYYFQWNIDSLELKQGDKVEYYLQVWDNDGVNGSKAAKTSQYLFQLPTKKELKDNLESASKDTQNSLDKTLDEAKDLKEKIEEAENRLKSKKSLNWQDKKLLEEIIKKKDELSLQIEKLKEQNQSNSMQQERFNPQSERIKEKVEQLQNLLDELLDEETRQLYEELRKLMEEQKDSEAFRSVLEELDQKEENLEQELERALELFKRLKLEQKLEETISDLKETQEEQTDLSEETGDKNNDLEDLKKDQKELSEDFKDIQEEIEQLREQNQELKNSKLMEDTSEEEENINKEQQSSEQQLQENNRKKAQKAQKQASEQMNKLSKKLQQMQNSMEMGMAQENLDNLREIEDNLVKLSFDQESLMKDFQEVNQSDPRFIELSQKQLKLRDDAKIIEDSLLSLANRVFQIKSFVTREVKEMNNYMDRSLEAIQKRNDRQISGNQQFTMTSVNNLALLLSDVLQQMQQQMADMQGAGEPKPGDKNMPGLSELQKQLNQQIEELKKSGKSGRALSEELAKLAAQQEMLRKALEKSEQALEDINNSGNKGNKETIEKMEQTETDLVNKKITSETIKRQKEILTRLLQSEKAMRERELDRQREGSQPKAFERKIPPAFDEYLKAKEKEIELLKTIPPKLNPYYKQEVNEYFKRLNK